MTEVVITEEVKKPKMDAQGRAYATGRRKTSVARVWIKPGKGNISINGKENYFSRATLDMVIGQPFDAVERVDGFDIFCTVKGGGTSGQAGAIRYAISKALLEFSPEYRPTLRKFGLLTRDARKVERKKYGRHKARKATQFSKR